MDYIDLYLCCSDQAAAAAALLAMTLGIALGPIWIFDASDAAAADARSERALRNVTSQNVTRPIKEKNYDY